MKEITHSMQEVLEVLNLKGKLLRCTTTKSDKLSKWTYNGCNFFDCDIVKKYTITSIGKYKNVPDLRWICLGQTLLSLESKGLVKFNKDRNIVFLSDKFEER